MADIDLKELDPSPVDDPIGDDKDSYFPPSSSPTPPVARSSTLGLSGHSLPFYLQRIQKYSSYTFSAFLTFHLANTSLIPLATKSVPESDKYLLLTRPYYQSILAEPVVVLLPLIAHVGSGIALRIYRQHQLAKRYGASNRHERKALARPKISGISFVGFMLVPLVAGHAFLNRILPVWVEGDSSGVGLSFVSHGFAEHPAISFAGFSLLISAATWHIVWGGAKWLGLTPSQAAGESVETSLRRKRRWYTLNALSVALAGLWMAGSLGVVGRGGRANGWVGRGYDNLYRQIPFIGKWL
ncbi:hypothetical protein L228DRAFT_238609 [Xylona heveae TC161]|uniref:Mitochondrial adapter protein MCP1 transmembrane domain-containing protein n=1 Tax=Xylona heveae (strain CBS 132557 / TC161) TaxID=1328760 RepID=A0A165GWL2_XYLHT|nr:hypothetical protein L228DRAFT_238609 [Xylona heveae TC161]KZF22691.1 hypothetical protein L228DRAFT_238609 [Xylona heveae TC161]